MNHQLLTTLSTINAFAILAFLLLIRKLVFSQKGYDEYQLQLSHRAYRYSMLTAWILLIVFNLVRFEAFTITQVTFFISLAVNFSYRIFYHSLTPLGKSSRFLTVLASLMLLSTISLFVVGSQVTTLTADEWVNGFAFLLSFGAIVGSLLYRSYLDQKAGEDD
jgi:hypothetical protein